MLLQGLTPSLTVTPRSSFFCPPEAYAPSTQLGLSRLRLDLSRLTVSLPRSWHLAYAWSIWTLSTPLFLQRLHKFILSSLYFILQSMFKCAEVYTSKQALPPPLITLHSQNVCLLCRLDRIRPSNVHLGLWVSASPVYITL